MFLFYEKILRLNPSNTDSGRFKQSVLVGLEISFIGAIIFWIQWIILGGCILTKWQYGTYQDTMWNHILENLKIKVNQNQLRFITTWILPIIIILLAYLIQQY